MKLKINERFGIKNLLNETYQKGGMDLTMFVRATKIVEKTDVEIIFADTPSKDGTLEVIGGENAVAVKMRQVPVIVNGQRVFTLRYEPKLDREKEIELSKKETELIAGIVKMKSERKELKMEDVYLVGLAEKLGIKVED